jgi:hypothetical protein
MIGAIRVESMGEKETDAESWLESLMKGDNLE